jgi:glycosyltransferase involved in cell wall biosynthesis
VPYFSVIIPTFNRAEFLSKAVESILAQTFPDWELIIVDDGSTDNTSDVIDSFNDQRIRYIYQQNAERSTARNNGIIHAKGKYICFLDSDDYYLPNHLMCFFDKIKETGEERAMYVTGIFEETPACLEKKAMFDQKYLHQPLMCYWENTILTPISVCLHNEILKENKFIPEFNIWEDTHLWLRILAQFPFYYITDYTAVSVRHDNSGVIRDMAFVNPGKVKKYIFAIDHLFANYPFILQHLNNSMKQKYIDEKYNMFLYSARRNRQYKVAFKILFRLLRNKPSVYNFVTLFKLILYCMIFPGKKRKINY